jgi:hypothetical protein
LNDVSEGGAYVHNLMAGQIYCHPDLGRSTPCLQPHSTAMASLDKTQGGDDRFYNNILVGNGHPAAGATMPSANLDRFGLCVYDAAARPLLTGGNVYLNGARPYTNELNPVVQPDVDPKVVCVLGDDHIDLHLNVGPVLRQADTSMVTTARLGKTRTAGLAYENPDGSPLKIDTDFFGAQRNPAHPTPGPFENPGQGSLILKVW